MQWVGMASLALLLLPFLSQDDFVGFPAVVVLRVVISTVGPFTKYGEPLVAACVRNRTDYIDSTGRVVWTSVSFLHSIFPFFVSLSAVVPVAL